MWRTRRTRVSILSPVELRVQDERPVVTISGGASLDPAQLPIPDELLAALREWARVASAVERTSIQSAPRQAVSGRGTHLAARLAAATGSRVTYVDPVTGATAVVGGVRRGEPTPWATGITVSVVCALVVILGMAILDMALAAASAWLGPVANVVLTAGLVPSVLLIRKQPVWRWVAYGIVAGLVLGWLGWLISVL